MIRRLEWQERKKSRETQHILSRLISTGVVSIFAYQNNLGYLVKLTYFSLQDLHCSEMQTHGDLEVNNKYIRKIECLCSQGFTFSAVFIDTFDNKR